MAGTHENRDDFSIERYPAAPNLWCVIKKGYGVVHINEFRGFCELYLDERIDGAIVF